MDLISRQAAIDVLSLDEEMLRRVLDDMDVVGTEREKYSWGLGLIESSIKDIEELPSAQPERKWISCANPPKHHKNVIVKGIEAIGNVTVYKVMQWGVDMWRPENYAPSIRWLEWCEI